MRLEDIKILKGDAITFDDGKVIYSNVEGVLRACYPTLPLDGIVKIERYVEYDGSYYYVDAGEYGVKGVGKYYLLETVWERKEILDKEEKEYLSNVIRPFRDRVEFITKTFFGDNLEYISIYMSPHRDNFELPCFKKDTMYKGMELNKEYTLEELGL